MWRKIVSWLSGLIPVEYSIGVAIKKIVLVVGNLAASFLAGEYLSKYVSPEQSTQIQVGLTAVVSSMLTALFDWWKLKYGSPKTP